jgi:hypothetical protein
LGKTTMRVDYDKFARSHNVGLYSHATNLLGLAGFESAGELAVPVGKVPLVAKRHVRFLFYRAHGYRGPMATSTAAPSPS